MKEIFNYILQKSGECIIIEIRFKKDVSALRRQSGERNVNMTPQLKNLLILLCGIAVVLLLVILLFGGKSPVMRFLSLFLEEDENVRATRMNDYKSRRQRRSIPAGQNNPAQSVRSADGDGIDTIEAQKSSSEPIVEMATLIQKSDDRLRVIENSGRVRMIDEYYELLFVTRKGQKLKIQCSPEAYEKVPFDEQGSLTYKKNTLVKFKLYDETIYNDHTEEEKSVTAS